jgi:hypothetical protein
VRDEFQDAMWVQDPAHLDTNMYFHVLSQWFWAIDVWNTWRLKGWLDLPSFHWVLTYSNEWRYNDYETLWATVHPQQEAPISTNFDLGSGIGAGGAHVPAVLDNYNQKVCYQKLMIGHIHTTQGMWRGVMNTNSLGQNSHPIVETDPGVEEFVQVFLDDYMERSYLKSVKPIASRALVITRRDTQRRRIINEEAIIQMLTDRGFDVDVIFYENIGPEEAAIRTRQASLVVGAHGAGFANTIVCHPDTIIYELHPFGFQKWVYAHLAVAKGNSYMYWAAPDESWTSHTNASLQATDPWDAYRHRDVVVDEVMFGRSLDLIEDTLIERNLFPKSVRSETRAFYNSVLFPVGGSLILLATSIKLMFVSISRC